MGWQLVVTVLLVSCAGLYLARRSWRTWFGNKAGCGGGCGCASKPRESVPPLISSDELLGRIQPKSKSSI